MTQRNRSVSTELWPAALMVCPSARAGAGWRRSICRRGGRIFRGGRDGYGLTNAFCQASGSPFFAFIAAEVGTSVARCEAIRKLGCFGARTGALAQSLGLFVASAEARARSKSRGDDEARSRSTGATKQMSASA